MGELAGRSDTSVVTEGFYEQISSILSTARDKAYTAVNFAMVEAYWEIGKSIVEQQGGEERATYGDALLKELASRLTEDFGKGFDARELRKMRQFHPAFPIRDALSQVDTHPQLRFSHVVHERVRRFPLEHTPARAPDQQEELARELSAEYRAINESAENEGRE